MHSPRADEALQIGGLSHQGQSPYCSGYESRRVQTIFRINLEIFILLKIFILLHEKFLQFDWLRVVVFQLNLKYLHVKITNLLRVVV